MKRTLLASIIISIAVCCAAVAAPKAPAAKKLTDKDKAGAVVQSFLENMDKGNYEAAFAFMDFDARHSGSDEERPVETHCAAEGHAD